MVFKTLDDPEARVRQKAVYCLESIADNLGDPLPLNKISTVRLWCLEHTRSTGSGGCWVVAAGIIGERSRQ